MAAEFKRTVGLFDATMLIAGSMIGSGVFIVGADIVRTGHSGGFLIAAWALTAVLTVLAALSYGELAGLFPHAGGQYTYLREIYGPMTGFLYGWTFFLVIGSGTIAAVAVGFGKYLGTFAPAVSESAWMAGPWTVPALKVGGIQVGPYPFGLTTARAAGIAVVAFLTYVNTRGVKLGTRVQNVFTVTKIGSLAALILLGLLLVPKVAPVPGPYVPPPASTPILPFVIALLVVQTGSLFSADAWNSVTFIAGEVKDPKRVIPLSLFIGTTLVCGLYILANAIYVKVLGPTGIATAPNDRVGSAALQAILGAGGGKVMAAAILVSMFGCINGLVLAYARVAQAMAADGLFISPAAKLNSAGVPGVALVLQAIWTAFLAMSGSYGQLLDYVIFAALLFYVLTVGGVILLRIRKPELERPVKVFAYPLLPALYLIGALAIMGALLLHKPDFTWPGLFIVLLGLPVYALTHRNGKPVSHA
ncbi:MAG TPA: amino acid permease [Holophagaceae bacterium]|nr:amino acid permease [Holophagaceae bacterium]